MSLTMWGRGTRVSLIWAFTYRKLSRSKDITSVSNAYTLAGAITATYFVLAPITSTKIVGWGARGFIMSPYAQAFYIPYLAGIGISALVDPKKGIDNYLGFTTGGFLGEQDINYWNTDPNDSGYFNVPKNLKVVGKATWEWVTDLGPKDFRDALDFDNV
jgi:hypothetical protein